MFRSSILATSFLFASTVVTAAEPNLFREPTLSKNHIVFSYAGDLWRVARDGGEAEQLTNGVGVESDPYFSPDGKTVAFTGTYDGNTDVFVMPVGGGTPTRLTYHPGPDLTAGWSADGTSVLFSSRRDSFARFTRLYTVPVDLSAQASMIPLPSAERGSFNAKGTHIAYEPLNQWQPAWKRYQGGQQDKVWIADLSDSSIVKVPETNSSDTYPMWIGDRVYFLSDRDSANFDVRLFSYDPDKGDVRLEYDPKGADLKSASAGPNGSIVLEEFGQISIFDTKRRRAKDIDITVNADILSVRKRFEKVGDRISNSAISPSGKRAVFEARGEILTVPAKDGDVRNLTRTTGVMERDPAWSPDGQSIAYLSDRDGEYALHIVDQKGEEDAKAIPLEPMFYYEPIWSPDSKKITLIDQADRLWLIDMSGDEATQTLVAKNPISNGGVLEASWSAKSDLITYAKQGKNLLRSIFIYDLNSGETHKITDGLTDARHPTFDKDGSTLYFTASTNVAETISWADMSGLARSTTRQVYAVLLTADAKSPLAKSSDEEAPAKKPDEEKVEKPADKPAEEKSGEAADETTGDAEAEEKKPDGTKLDLDGIMNRTILLPGLDAPLSGLQAGAKGEVFATEPVSQPNGPSSLTVHKFTKKDKRFKKVAGGISQITLTADGKKALVRRGRSNWSIVATGALDKPGRPIATARMSVRVDPEAEWPQMFNEIWRGERDFFYAENLHGLDLEWAKKTYGPFVGSVRHRSDFSYLLTEMLGQLTIGHMFISGGDQESAESVPGGLLGADYSVNNGRYRFDRIYRGDAYAGLNGPLNEPGLNVEEGDYLLAVDGVDLMASDNVHAAFEATAGRSVRLTIAKSADGEDSRDIMVIPTGNDSRLRNAAWIADNMAKVTELSDGKLAYIYMPNTAGPGFNSFNRYFYAQTDKEGAVLDERFNGGGLLSDYVTNVFNRQMFARIFFRHGEMTIPVPAGAIYGPKAMIINEMAGSGGDAMPWFFQKSGSGTLVGKRTWGGLVAAQGLPRLMDGGFVRAPDAAVYDLDGNWVIENRGTGPDIEVDWDPAQWRQGRDPQLEATVKHLLEELAKNPPKTYPTPVPPDYFEAGRQ